MCHPSINQGNPLKFNKLSYAIITALGVSSIAVAQTTETPKSNRQIETIEVTATKRVESIQEVPVTVSALSGDALENLGVDNFQDYVEFLPNVVFQGTGPGQNEIYIRGAATSQTNIAVSTVQALQPSVAFYLDEQPVSMQGRNLDIYAADIARIEVLPGPQGTLFGASSQSGTVRMITNKPSFSGFAGGVDLGGSFTKDGEMSNSVQAFLNFTVRDDLAVRITAYNDNQGGWIDNIRNDPSQGGFKGSAAVISRISGNVLSNPSAAEVITPNNDALVEEDANDANYAGFRLGIAHEINDEWDILVQHTQQQLDTEGVFAYDPNLAGTQSVNRFQQDKNSDTFGLTTWTLSGRLAELDVVYTGGLLGRDISSTVDYTGYTNGGLYAAFYTCMYSGLAPEDVKCLDPTKFYKEETDTSRSTHEFRINTDASNNWRITAGIFYDSQELSTVGKFKIANTEKFPNLAAETVGKEGINSNGGPFESEVSFVNDVTHIIDQIAVFGQAEYDVSDTVTISAGARWYQIEDKYTGSTSTVDVTRRLRAFGTLDAGELAEVNLDPAAVAEAIASGQIDVSLLDDNGVLTVDDVIYKASVDWKPNDDVLLFATYSEGFRPPVTNRVGGGLATNQTGAFDGFRIPVYSTTDTLKNYEVGMKGDFFDGILRVNATAFFSDITDLQTSRFDPTNISFLVFTDNVGDAEIQGIDGDITWLASDNLILDASFSLLDTELTRINSELDGIAPPVGAELPYSASFSGNIRARYFYEMENGLTGFVNGSVVYTGDRLASMTMDAYVLEDTSRLVYGRGSGLSIQNEASLYEGVNYTDTSGNTFAGGRYIQDSYVLANLAFGVTNDEWKAEIFVDNVFDERAVLHVDNQQFTPKVVTNRPRTIGFRFSYDFF
ncbi:MAG: iron complex outermembrane receptor protein [Kangiellaceae bacterium]|jgi:outer membrane receptor protein involved in Fe transport